MFNKIHKKGEEYSIKLDMGNKADRQTHISHITALIALSISQVRISES